MNSSLQKSARKGLDRWGRWVGAMMLGVLVSACSSLPQLPLPKRSAQPPVASAPAKQKKPAPVATPALKNFSGQCRQVEEDGFAENARLNIVNGQVRALDWHIKVKRKGQCQFNLHDFQQTRQAPHIELKALGRGRRAACKLMVYQESRRVTLAHNGCEAFCSKADLAEEAWPVMFNPRTGGCASLDR
ncbi:MAG: hypothetical protein Q4B17_00730 [Lautropia sp.]|nr:hypothetical protein [Lautropia sp.]